MKKYVYALAILIAVLISYYIVNTLFTVSIEIPTTVVKNGEFVITQSLHGSVDSKQSYTITAPRIRGLQITWLASEGTTVQKGDPVVKFDATKQLADLSEHESNMKIAKTSLERAQREYTIQDKVLRLDLKRAQRNYDEMKHDAPKLAEEAKIELELAELNFNAKLEQFKADVVKAELEVERAQERVNVAKYEVEQTAISAPIPGLIVYLDLWKGGTMSKVQEGDSPWPGQGLINLPDLSEMVVKAEVSEVDASKIDSGQTVIITLDAFPEIEYKGIVASKGTLARRKESGSKVNVFDVEISIVIKDEKIKPGMSASCKVVIDRLPDVVYTSLESVFEKNGKPVVYLENKKKREVEVGRRNNMDIEIKSGLEGGERVCLVDPTLDEHGLPGDRATEPELNKGRQSKKNSDRPPRRKKADGK